MYPQLERSKLLSYDFSGRYRPSSESERRVAQLRASDSANDNMLLDLSQQLAGGAKAIRRPRNPVPASTWNDSAVTLLKASLEDTRVDEPENVSVCLRDSRPVCLIVVYPTDRVTTTLPLNFASTGKVPGWRSLAHWPRMMGLAVVRTPWILK